MAAPGHQADALTRLADALDACALPYMLTGSTAALFYGRDRSTVDVDVVVDCEGADFATLAGALGPGYFLDAEAASRLAATGAMFNAIPVQGGPKVDFIPLTHAPFEQAKFGRRVQLAWHGRPIHVITAADLALSKLEWARESRSQRQLADVRAILAFEGFEEDDYFREWVRRLRLEEVLDASREARYDA
jgi:hypothetical protein